MSIIDMIQEEQAASLEYKKLAAMARHREHRRAFLEMSRDELKHSRMLRKMIG